MLRSKRSLEGYLMIDHSAINCRGALFESATLTCSHCQRVVVLNPDRSRERGYCTKCDNYLCDQCALVRAQTGDCKTFGEIMDEVELTALKASLII